MTRKNRRNLSSEERALWNKVVEQATPLKARAEPSVPRLSKETPRAAPPPKPMIAPFTIGAKPGARATTPAVQPSPPPVVMDRKAFHSLSRGKLRPEARIDLHGMTLDQAHPQLVGFILSAYAAGKRLVLVITGKGKTSRDDGPIPERKGILRHHVPHWLAQGPLAPCVLQVTQSHRRHGGDGAFYVYLRRQR